MKRVRAWLDYKARYEALLAKYERTTQDQQTEIDQLIIDNTEQAKRVDELLLDNTALLDVAHNLDVEVGKLKLELDEALRPKVPPSDGAAKKPRASRVKPPLNE